MYNVTEFESKAEPTDHGVQHHFSDSVYAKQMFLPAGHIAMSHKHSYSHLSILSSGSCIVTCEIGGVETSKQYEAPAALEIQAGVNHQIEAIDDVTWFCIHATEEKDPAKIDEVAILKQ